MELDVLVVAAHPDDAEISVGGTLLRFVDAGRAVGIVDMTRGEMGTRGTAEDRSAETAAASALLEVAARVNLGLPDGRVDVTIEAREALARVIRTYRPRLVLAHHEVDLHPDHVATGRLAREAWYLAGLRRLAEQDGGPPAYRPPRLMHFMSHIAFEPTVVVDIGPVWERKLALVRCYATQLAPEDAADRGEHFLFGSDIEQRVETKARTWGERIGATYGEPLMASAPLPIEDVERLL